MNKCIVIAGVLLAVCAASCSMSRETRYRRWVERSSAAVKTDPANVSEWGSLSHAWFSLGEPEKALAAARECVERNPENGDALAVLGRTWMQYGDGRKAAEVFAEVERVGFARENSGENLSGIFIGDTGDNVDVASLLKQAERKTHGGCGEFDLDAWYRLIRSDRVASDFVRIEGQPQAPASSLPTESEDLAAALARYRAAPGDVSIADWWLLTEHRALVDHSAGLLDPPEYLYSAYGWRESPGADDHLCCQTFQSLSSLMILSEDREFRRRCADWLTLGMAAFDAPRTRGACMAGILAGIWIEHLEEMREGIPPLHNTLMERFAWFCGQSPELRRDFDWLALELDRERRRVRGEDQLGLPRNRGEFVAALRRGVVAGMLTGGVLDSLQFYQPNGRWGLREAMVPVLWNLVQDDSTTVQECVELADWDVKHGNWAAAIQACNKGLEPGRLKYWNSDGKYPVIQSGETNPPPLLIVVSNLDEARVLRFEARLHTEDRDAVRREVREELAKLPGGAAFRPYMLDWSKPETHTPWAYYRVLIVADYLDWKESR